MVERTPMKRDPLALFASLASLASIAKFAK